MTDVPPPPPPPSYGAPPPSGGSPDVGAALSYGWKKFQENVGPILGIVAVYAGTSILFSIVAFAVRSTIILYLLVQILGFVVGAIVSYGIYRAALMITAGEQIDFAKAFENNRWGEWIVFSFVYSLIVAIGLALCIIPGLVAIAFFGLAPYYFIDQRMSLGDALSASRAAAGSKGLGLPVLLCAIVGALGIILCLIGVFVTAPIAFIAVAYLYRYAQGQPVAA